MTEEKKPTQEDIDNVANVLVRFLIDMKRTLNSAIDLTNKPPFGFNHLRFSLENCVKNIDEYLAQYEKQKAKK